MSFITLLKQVPNDKDIATIPHKTEESVNEAPETPEALLRGAGLKIRLVTPTSFGTQIDFAKQYDDEKIQEILANFDIKIKGKSVFVIK